MSLVAPERPLKEGPNDAVKSVDPRYSAESHTRLHYITNSKDERVSAGYFGFRSIDCGVKRVLVADMGEIEVIVKLPEAENGILEESHDSYTAIWFDAPSGRLIGTIGSDDFVVDPESGKPGDRVETTESRRRETFEVLRGSGAAQ